MILLLGATVATHSWQGMWKPRLPADVSATLFPPLRPKLVDLGHQGGPLGDKGKRSESEGLVLIDAPLDAALLEYGRLTGSTVLRPNSITNLVINFRGQDRPAALARKLLRVILAEDVRLVSQLDRRQIAAVPTSVPLLWQYSTNNQWNLIELCVGLLLVLGGLFLAAKSPGDERATIRRNGFGARV